MVSNSISLLDGVHAVLRKSGPLSMEELIAELEAQGFGLHDEHDLSDLIYSQERDLVVDLLDERLALLSSLARAVLLTHRVSEHERDHDFLIVDPDFSPFVVLSEGRELRLADGSVAFEVWPGHDDELLAERGIPVEAMPDEGVLLLPAGKLSELGVIAGDLICLGFTPSGFELTKVDPSIKPDPGTTLAQRLRALLDDDEAIVGPVELHQAVWTAVADGGELLQELTVPLGQVIDDADLAREGEWLARGEFNFPAWRAELQLRSVRISYRLTIDQAVSVMVMSAMCSQLGALMEVVEFADDADEDLDEEIEDAIMRESLGSLEDPAVAKALFAETLEQGSLRGLGLFAASMESMAPRSARAALRWLQAKAKEGLGEVLEAEQACIEALELDSGFHPAALDLARYSCDRGNANAGLEYLRRAGADADANPGLAHVLEHFAAAGRADLGGKQPCWCGSGRKYKRCHLGKEQLPLDERAAWLYQKAVLFIGDGAHRTDMIELAYLRTQFSDSADAFLHALDDGLIADVVMFEGGVFAEFLTERGVLLPDDERLLGAQWLLIERSLYEVDTVRPGDGMTVRDVRTGDRVEVRERTASRQLRVGDLICTRLLPAGDTIQLFGGVEPVEMHQRKGLMALLDGSPTPSELIEFHSGRFAPPVITNTEGDPMMMCEATVHIEDPLTLRIALDRRYERTDDTGTADGDGDGEWIEFVTTDDLRRVRAHLRLTANTLRIEANSEARFERVLAEVHAIAPGAPVTSESRTTAAELLREALDPRVPADESAEIDPHDPEIQEFLAKTMLVYEKKWLDESIPALAGRTPRQAAADPTRREDLIRLLNTFPPATNSEGMASMDPARLRAALNL